MNKTRKELKAFEASLLICLTLATCALALPVYAGTWFSESEYAYLVGGISFLGSEKAEGMLAIYPEGSDPIGKDPTIQIQIFNGWTCYMTEFTDMYINENGKDYYAAGTWEIQKGTVVHTDNASDIAPNMAGMGITKVAILTWHVDISDIEYALTEELHITDVTVIYFIEQNFTSLSIGKRADETGKFTPGFWLGVNDSPLGYFDSVIFFGSDVGGTGIEIRLPSVNSHVSGEVSVTGNWTSLVVTIEGVATLSGEVIAGKVKYGTVDYFWAPPGQTTIIDDDTEIMGPDPRSDVNGDGMVDIIDITIVAAAFGTAIGEEGYDPQADLNDDSVIDIVDVTIPAKDFRKSF